MNHQEFIQKYKNREISISVNKEAASFIVKHGHLGKSYLLCDILFSLLFIIGLISSIILFFVYSKAIGIIVFVISLFIPGALKKSASQGIIDKIIEDPDFYERSYRIKSFYDK